MANVLEITAEIVVAMINNNKILFKQAAHSPEENNKNAAMAVAEAYKIVFEAVNNPLGK